MSELLHTMVEWLVETIGTLGYPGIFALMFLESSFFPFPSEVVVPPAGYLAFQGRMSMPIVILMGTLGSVAGAYFNYALAYFLGKPFILRYGPYVGFSNEKFEKANAFFVRHGEIGTFVCRLLPGIRQLISMPAGLARMNLLRFGLFTGLGAAIWVSVLAWVGYWVGDNRELVHEMMSKATVWVVLASAVLVFAYIAWYRRKRNGIAAADLPPEA